MHNCGVGCTTMPRVTSAKHSVRIGSGSTAVETKRANAQTIAAIDTWHITSHCVGGVRYYWMQFAHHSRGTLVQRALRTWTGRVEPLTGASLHMGHMRSCFSSGHVGNSPTGNHWTHGPHGRRRVPHVPTRLCGSCKPHDVEQTCARVVRLVNKVQGTTVAHILVTWATYTSWALGAHMWEGHQVRTLSRCNKRNDM